ncbi:MAG: hypothetical protein V3U37_05180 [Nitrospinaceae bacterium]
MEDLDSKIDAMGRPKLLSLIQEKAVRKKKINIRFTKNNQKNTIERLDALYGSYEKLLREIIRSLLNIEKEVRRKYVVPLEEARKRYLISHISEEIEVILSQMIDDLRPDYVYLNEGDGFDRRIEQSGLSTREQLEKQMAKLMESLNAEVVGSEKVSPGELSRIYSIDESALVDLKAIKPLQNIHTVFNSKKDDEACRKAFDAVHHGILSCVKLGQASVSGLPVGNTVEARKKKKMKLIFDTLLLKDLIYNINILVEQIGFPSDQRNVDVIQKTWSRLQGLFQGNREKESIFSNLLPLYEVFGL